MDAQKKEIRTLDCQLSVREVGENAQGDSRTIVGKAIVFNAESRVLDDWGYRFREVILPEACTKEFLDTQDVKMNMLHDRALTVARCNKGQGSLRLSVDDTGVNFEFEAPRCDIGDRCLEMVRRGDYSGCSFEFYPDKYDVEKIQEGDAVNAKITHRHFRALGALTIGLDPAYTQTTVNAREIIEDNGESDEEKAAREQREQEEKERQEREAREAQELEEREQREREAIAVAHMRRKRAQLRNIEEIYY